MLKNFFKLFIFLFLNYNIFCLSEINSLLDAGLNDYSKAQYNFAINNLKKYIQISDDNTNKPKAYYFLALSYYFSDNYKLALNTIKELTTKYRNSSYSSVSYFWKGLIYQNLQEWDDAENNFIQFINIFPNSDLLDRAYLALANSQIQNGKNIAAENSLKTIIDKFKKSEKYEEASILYAYILMKNKKFNEQINFLKKWDVLLGENGGNYKFKDRFWLYIAEYYLDNKEYEQAKIYFKKIDNYCKNTTSNEIALLRLSEIEQQNNNNKEAREYIIRLSVEYPNSKYNIDGLLLLGIEEYKKENYSDAIVLLKQTLLTIDKKSIKKDLDKEEKDRLNSIRNKTYFYLAEIYSKTNELNLAINYYKEIISNPPYIKTEALLKLMDIYAKQNRISELNKLIEKEENFIVKDIKYKDNFFIFKAKNEYLNKNYNEALRVIDLITDKNKFIVEISSLKSNIYLKQNKNREALNILNDLLLNIAINEKAKIAYDIMSLSYNLSDYNNVLSNYNVFNTYLKYVEDKKDQIKLKLKSDFLYGLTYLQLKDYEKSILTFKNLQSFSKSENLDKEDLRIYNSTFYYLGWIYYKLSNFIEAAKNFSTASLLDIEDSLKKDSYYMEAFSYYSNKDYQNASIKFESIYKLYFPEEISIKSYYQLAKCYENLGKKNFAIDIYNKIYSDNKIVYYKEQVIFELVKYYLQEKNISYANQLIKSFPENSVSSYYKDSLFLLAETFISLERYSEAFSTYNFFITKFPDDENVDLAYYWGGFCSEKIKNYEEAEKLLVNLINKYTKSSFYYNSLVLLKNIYNNTKNYNKEKNIIVKLLENEKNNEKIIELKNRIAEIELIQKGTDIIEAELIVKSNNGDQEARYQLALYYIKNNNKDKGITILKDLANNNKQIEGAKANLFLGDLELENNNYEEAVKIYLKTSSSYTSNSDIITEALYKGALCYFYLNKKPLAIKIIEKIKTYNENEWVKKSKDLEKRLFE